MTADVPAPVTRVGLDEAAVAALRAAAEAATPGPWKVASTVEGWAVHRGEHDTIALYADRSNAAFIAAANPAVVLALLDALAAVPRPATGDRCDGSGLCEARLHVHGCYADRDGSACDDPSDHDNADDEARIAGAGRLTDLEHEALLIAWPWPKEAATTKDGFGEVVATVERILTRRRRLAAVPRPATQPEGTTITEWGVRSPITGITTEYGADLSDVVDLWTAAGLHVVSRQRTSYPDHVTDWEHADD